MILTTILIILAILTFLYAYFKIYSYFRIDYPEPGAKRRILFLLILEIILICWIQVRLGIVSILMIIINLLLISIAGFSFIEIIPSLLIDIKFGMMMLIVCILSTLGIIFPIIGIIDISIILIAIMMDIILGNLKSN